MAFGSAAARLATEMDHLTRLLLDARDGDRAALERFVAETQADVWRLCRYLGDAVDADDLAQETYERAIGSLHRYRADGPARGWLLTVARRVCVDHTRRAQRRRRRDGAVRDDHVAGGGTGRLLVGDETERVALDDLLSALDDDRRGAFVLTQVLGLRYDEAAEVLGCPVGTIRSRVSRARVDLADLLVADETDERAPGGAVADGDRTTGDRAAGGAARAAGTRRRRRAT